VYDKDDDVLVRKFARAVVCGEVFGFAGKKAVDFAAEILWEVEEGGKLCDLCALSMLNYGIGDMGGD